MSRRGSSRPTRSTRPARLAAVSAGLVLAVAATTAGVAVDQAGAPTTTGATPLVAPRSATEQALCDAWQDLLGIAQVGVNDDFYLLGGHSLLTTQLASRIRTVLKVEIALRALFDTPFGYEEFAGKEGLVGHAGIVIFDDTADMLSLARFDARSWAGELGVPAVSIIPRFDGVVPVPRQVELAEVLGAGRITVDGDHRVAAVRPDVFLPALQHACTRLWRRAA